MGHYDSVRWQPVTVDGVPRRVRTGGVYRAYVPDPLSSTTPITVPPELVDRAAQATAALTSTALATDVTGLGALLALGVRSEAIASSVIEGLQASAPQRDLLERREHRIIHGLAGEGRSGLGVEIIQRGLQRRGIHGARPMPHGLAIDHIVAITAPGVEHFGVGPRLLTEQGRCGGEAGGALLYRIAARLLQIGAHPFRSSIINPAVALADPTTPGMPAPGCVPAPTK